MTLEEIYKKSIDISDIDNIPNDIKNSIKKIGKVCEKKKGLYTVLVTLMYYKHLHPEQDIRYFQAKMENGFSARTFDTYFVTPVLKKLNLPAMAESGWLTRSLEQPYPYTLNYNGEVGPLKTDFLKTIDFLQNNSDKSINMLRLLLNQVDKIAKASVVIINPLENPENLTIDKIINALTEHFLEKYGTHYGAKLPVLAFHSIYLSLIAELKRYENCDLADLSSLTACDKTIKASGDIEIFRDGKVYEAIEIKLDKKITSQIIRVVESKVYKWNPQRYYVLSAYGIDIADKEEIDNIVLNVQKNHGCQIIINGLLQTIRYYLRLINNLDDFVKNYSNEVKNDKELQKVHKEKWAELLAKYEL